MGGFCQAIDLLKLAKQMQCKCAYPELLRCVSAKWWIQQGRVCHQRDRATPSSVYNISNCLVIELTNQPALLSSTAVILDQSSGFLKQCFVSTMLPMDAILEAVLPPVSDMTCLTYILFLPGQELCQEGAGAVAGYCGTSLHGW